MRICSPSPLAPEAQDTRGVGGLFGDPHPPTATLHQVQKLQGMALFTLT